MVGKNVILAYCSLFQYSNLGQLHQILAGCGVMLPQFRSKFGGGDHRIGEQGVYQFTAVELWMIRLKLRLEVVIQGGDLFQRLSCFPGLPEKTAEHELDVGLPFVIRGHGQQALVIFAAVLVDVPADVQHRHVQQTGLDELQDHQDAPRAAVAVSKGMDGFELVMGHDGADQGIGGGLFCVDVGLPNRRSGFAAA
jgi:hypothetical protein